MGKQEKMKLLGGLKPVRCAQGAITGIVVWTFLFLYRELANAFVGGIYLVDAIRETLGSTRGVVLWALLLIVCVAGGLALSRWRKPVGDFLFRFRYGIAALFLAVMVIAEVSGSSLALWASTLEGDEVEGLLFGMPRWMRTDEWATSLAMVFAQFNDESGFLPYFGEVFRGSDTDMFWLNAPVADYATLFRPFMWGYLFLGLARGLAFWWNARFVVLFMVSFEFALRFFGRSRTFALAYALFVAFAPAVAWWNMGDQLIYIQALFLVALLFLRAGTWPRRLAFATLFFYVLGCYVLVVYPAWQVPFGLLIAICGIVFAVQQRKTLVVKPLQMVVCCIPGIVLLAVSFGYLLSTSAETIQAVTSTVYPGKRVEFGGGDPAALFRYPMSLFTPLTTGGLSTDRVDMLSSFFDFLPLGLLMALHVLIREKRIDGVLIALLVMDVFFLAYYLVGFPEWLAKITLMSYTTSERMVVVIGFTNLLLLFKACSLLREPLGRKLAIVASVGFAAVLCAVAFVIEPAYMNFSKLVVAFVVLGASCWCFLAKRNDWLVIAALTIGLFGGAMVNPVQVGVAPVEDDLLIEKIRELKAESDGRWISETDWAENIPTLGGAPTLSSTHTYPDMDLWAVLDPDGSEEDIYNRYAHLRMTLDDGDESVIELLDQDVVSATVPLDLLDDLDVSYVVTERDLTEYNSSPEVDFVRVYDGVHYDIYEVIEETAN